MSQVNQSLAEYVDILEKRVLQLSHSLKQTQEQLNSSRKLEKNYQVLAERFYTLATTDSLTGISNRRRFDEYLKEEWLRMRREKQSLSLILGDVDYFKQYNDFFGHLAGDECLKQIAQAIKKASKRPGDLVARYGGEEIAIILPYTDANGAQQLATEFRTQIEQLNLKQAPNTSEYRVTLSFGVATTVPSLKTSPKELIAAADLALYSAKTLGRNRVVVKTVNSLAY